MYDDYVVSPIIIDIGESQVKAGFGGDVKPKQIFPTVVGRLKQKPVITGFGGHRDSYVGHEALQKRELLNLNNPISNGLVTNWDDFEKIGYHTFYNELRAAPEEHPVLLSEHPQVPKSDREKMTQIMFETYSVPAFYVLDKQSLALIGVGKTNGVVLDIGYAQSVCTPVQEEFALRDSVYTTNIGGKIVSDNLKKQLSDKDLDEVTIEDIKKNVCYVSKDYANESELEAFTTGSEVKYDKPDGSTVSVFSERYSSPEILFQPSLNGLTDKSVQQILFETINNLAQLKLNYCNNIVISGGSSMLKGFEERIEVEISKLLPNENIRISAPKDRDILTWIGGSIISSLPSFQNKWISKEEYDESGPRIVHRKCL